MNAGKKGGTKVRMDDGWKGWKAGRYGKMLGRIGMMVCWNEERKDERMDGVNAGTEERRKVRRNDGWTGWAAGRMEGT